MVNDDFLFQRGRPLFEEDEFISEPLLKGERSKSGEHNPFERSKTSEDKDFENFQKLKKNNENQLYF